MKIKTKLLLTYVAIATVAVILVCIPVIGIQIAQLKSNAGTMLKASKDSITSFLDTPKTIVKSVVPYIQTEAFTIEQGQKKLLEVINGKPEIYCLYWADDVPMNRGGRVCSSDGWIPGLDYDKMSRDWFYKAYTATDVVVTEPYVDEDTGSLVCSISTPVLENGKANGVIAIDIMLDTFNNIVESLHLTNNGHAYLVDSKGDFLTNDDLSKILNANFFDDYPTLKNLKDEIFSSTSQAYINTGAGKFYVASQCIDEELGWTLITVGPSGEVFASVNAIISIAVLVGVVVIAGAILVSFVIANVMSRPLNNVNAAVKNIASGNANLAQRLNTKNQNQKDEIGELVTSFNSFLAKLQEIVTQVKSSKSRLSDAKDDLSSSSTQVASTITQFFSNITSIGNQIENQSKSVTQTADIVTEHAENIDNLNEMIESQSSGVSQATATVEELLGNIASITSIVEKMTESFNALERITKDGIQKNKVVSEKISLIEEQSKSLLDANAAITNVAAQTNLLAMNAAIEAAHAGDSGKGFSVVAGEIRKLSENSSAESKKISEELKKITETINSIVVDARKSATSFEDVNRKNYETNQLVNQIKLAMQEQQEGSRQIIAALKMMNESTSQVKNFSHDMTAKNQQILAEVNTLLIATDIIKNAMEEMLKGAKEMNNTSVVISDVSARVVESVDRIGGQIDEFQV